MGKREFSAFFRQSRRAGIAYELTSYGGVLLCALLLSRLLEGAMESQWARMYRTGAWATGALLAVTGTQYALRTWRSKWELADIQSFRMYLYRRVIDRELSVENPGEMSVRMNDDVETVARFFQKTQPSAICAGVVILCSTVLLCRIHLGIGMIFFCLNLTQLLPVLLYEKWARDIYNQTHTDEETYNNWMIQGYNGIRTLKAYGAEAWYMSRYNRLNRAIVASGARAEKTGTVENIVFNAIDALLNYGSYAIIGAFILSGGVALHRAPILIALSGYLFSSMSSVFELRLQQFDYEEGCVRLRCGKATAFRKGCDCLLQVQNVYKSFRERPVLYGASLKIYAGEQILLRGTNGSGKSTLLRILAGLERADSGEIFWGIPREQCALALQEEAQPAVTGEELLRAMANAKSIDRESALRYAQGLGVGAILGKSLTEMSPGERKKFFMCAALAHQGSCLILDEPTNHMDGESVAYLNQVLREYPGTLLVCSHTAQLELSWDRIITLEGGVCRESKAE